VTVEALFFLLLIGDKILLIAALLEVQCVAFPLLMGAERGPALFPPRLVEFVFIEFRCLFVLKTNRFMSECAERGA